MCLQLAIQAILPALMGFEPVHMPLHKITMILCLERDMMNRLELGVQPG